MKRSSLLAIARKDFREMLNSKQIRMVMFIVPAAMVLMMPVIITIMSLNMGNLEDAVNELGPAVEQIAGAGSGSEALMRFFYNSAMTGMFLMVPLMMSSVSAANSFVGERERHTLETLLFSPNSMRALFTAKMLGCFAVSMLVTLVSFVLYAAYVTVSGYLIAGVFLLDPAMWAVMILGISPACTALGIVFTVRSSAKSETFQEAQQKATILVLPVVVLMMTQFMGLFLMNWWIGVIGSVVVWGITALLIRTLAARLDPERMIR